MWAGMFDLWNSHIVSPTAHAPQPMPGDARELLRQLVWDRVKLLAPALADVHVPNPRPFIKTDPQDDPTGGVVRKRSRLSDPVPMADRRVPPLMLDMTADSDLDEDDMARQAAQQAHAHARGGHRVTASGAHKRQHTTSSAESLSSSPAKVAAHAAAPPFKRLKTADHAAQVASIGVSSARHANVGIDTDADGNPGGAWDDMQVDTDMGPFFPAPPAPEPLGAGDIMMQDAIHDQDQPPQDDDNGGNLPALRRSEFQSPGRQLQQGVLSSSSSPARAFARGPSSSPARRHVLGAASASALASPARSEHGRSLSTSPARAAPDFAPQAPAAAAPGAIHRDRPMHRRRAPRIKWTPEEEDALERAMGECDGSWARMLRKYPEELGRFTQVQLKDKARNVRAKRERAGEDLGVFALATTYPAKERDGAEEEQGAATGARRQRRVRAAAAAAAASGQEDDEREEEDEERDADADEFPIRVGRGSWRMARQLGQPLALSNAQDGGHGEENSDEQESQQGHESQGEPQEQPGQGDQDREEDEEGDQQHAAAPSPPRQTRNSRGARRPPRRPMPRVTRSSARIAASQSEAAEGQEKDEDEEGQQLGHSQEDLDEYRPEEDDDEDDA
ncbi:hypothetical protein BCR44DRAFT_1426985 [Catenaria anguillulae PL171]|uniref:Myb-like domain-containing protein n=1 Tax=Catenaria anguillulae PL171 TaxID=765915 RepID=A0A1Y2HYI0_9FUNG|nr:hypothetical protein BCR44DRAFT_1426985 [Catenaria anguillulae PL171]